MKTKTAVVVGALGVIRGYIVERLCALLDCQEVGLSRRKGKEQDRIQFISVDLLDSADVARKLEGLGDAILAWPVGDYVFGCDWDLMTSTTKARQHGSPDVVDGEEMLVRLLTRFRSERIVP